MNSVRKRFEGGEKNVPTIHDYFLCYERKALEYGLYTVKILYFYSFCNPFQGQISLVQQRNPTSIITYSPQSSI